MARFSLSVRPLPASLALVCGGVGAFVLIVFATITLIPVLFTAGLLLAILAGALIFVWAGIEGLAALERWIESDSRFKD